MIFVTTFVGIPPAYWVTCLKQIRLFTAASIWCVSDHMDHDVIQKISQISNSVCIDYKKVKDPEFDKVALEYAHKFSTVNGLVGREQLYLRSIERMFICKNLMTDFGLNDVFFLEIDNLIYTDPNRFINSFKEKNLAYMLDNVNRASSGVMYIRDAASLSHLCCRILEYLVIENTYICDMHFLFIYSTEFPDNVQYVPTFPPSADMPLLMTNGFGKFDTFIFDSVAIGTYMFGLDPYHTGQVVKRGKDSPWSWLKASNYTFEMRPDDQGRLCPWIKLKDKTEFPIFNLHIHSKMLEEAKSDVSDS